MVYHRARKTSAPLLFPAKARIEKAQSGKHYSLEAKGVRPNIPLFPGAKRTENKEKREKRQKGVQMASVCQKIHALIPFAV